MEEEFSDQNLFAIVLFMYGNFIIFKLSEKLFI